MGVCDFHLLNGKAVSFMFLLCSFFPHIRMSEPEKGR